MDFMLENFLKRTCRNMMKLLRNLSRNYLDGAEPAFAREALKAVMSFGLTNGRRG